MLDLSKNHFELFDLPLGFAVDAKRLAERYLALQALTHPERVGGADDGDPQATLQVEEAYRTLMDPLSRAKYLLGLHARTWGASPNASEDGSFLIEQLEHRKALAEVRKCPDPCASLARVLTELAERGAALDKELEHLVANPSADRLAGLPQILRKLELLDRCRREVEELETQLGSG